MPEAAAVFSNGLLVTPEYTVKPLLFFFFLLNYSSSICMRLHRNTSVMSICSSRYLSQQQECFV